jgi:hypothetical protein
VPLTLPHPVVPRPARTRRSEQAGGTGGGAAPPRPEGRGESTVPMAESARADPKVVSNRRARWLCCLTLPDGSVSPVRPEGRSKSTLPWRRLRPIDPKEDQCRRCRGGVPCRPTRRPIRSDGAVALPDLPHPKAMRDQRCRGPCRTGLTRRSLQPDAPRSVAVSTLPVAWPSR